MTNAELATWLNDKVSLPGEAIVTVDVIRQWVLWDLLPRARGRGRAIGQSREWSRDGVAISRAVRLAELRGHGLIKQDELRVQLWLEGADFDFQGVRHSLGRRFRSLVTQTLRPISSAIDPTVDDATDAGRRALGRQLGEQASVFRGSPLELKSDQTISAYGVARFGSPSGKVMSDMLKGLLPGVHVTVLEESLANGIVGSLGAPDEIEGSALEAIAIASPEQLGLARRLFTNSMHGLKIFSSGEFPLNMPSELREFQSVVRQTLPLIVVGPWPVSIFASNLNSVVKAGGNLAPVTKFIEEMEALNARLFGASNGQWYEQ